MFSFYTWCHWDPQQRRQLNLNGQEIRGEDKLRDRQCNRGKEMTMRLLSKETDSGWARKKEGTTTRDKHLNKETEKLFGLTSAANGREGRDHELHTSLLHRSQNSQVLPFSLIKKGVGPHENYTTVFQNSPQRTTVNFYQFLLMSKWLKTQPKTDPQGVLFLFKTKVTIKKKKVLWGSKLSYWTFRKAMTVTTAQHSSICKV